jgi:hypothetical protein
MTNPLNKIMGKPPGTMTPLEECIGWAHFEGPSNNDEENHKLAEQAAQELENSRTWRKDNPTKTGTYPIWVKANHSQTEFWCPALWNGEQWFADDYPLSKNGWIFMGWFDLPPYQKEDK